MKLLLASSGLSYIKEFVGKDPKLVDLLFIPTAGNMYDNVWWIDKDRAVLADMGFKITELDIEGAAKDKLQTVIDETDVVYVAGGNTFYLLNQLRRSGFGEMLDKFVENGGKYVGASAGALVAGPDIEIAATADELVPDLESTRGLGWVDIVPMPHYGMSSRTKSIDNAVNQYKSKYKVVPITDDQAILVDGGDLRIVDSPRNKLEFEWFERNSDDLV